ncbi:hypothetical protein GGQ85_004246 [Nitrobacter vulgaris]|nr:hypothetical protein [Nitrobacter vulgaris]
MVDNNPPPAPDSARSSGTLVSSDKYNGKAVYGAEDKKRWARSNASWSTSPPASRPMPC